MVLRVVSLLLLSLALLTASVEAEPLNVKVVTSPKEQIYVDLPTPEKHFVLLVKREGKAVGTGNLQDIKGAGIIHIEAVSPTDREFQLTGEVAVVKK